MKASQKAIDLIKEFEGFEPKAYICPAGILTIGYGTTKNVQRNQIITESVAEQFLMRDLQSIENQINNAVKVSLNQNQFDALVSFVYNLGIGNLTASTLLRKLNANDLMGAANEFPKWNKATVNGVKKELAGLTKRREAERKLFLSV